MARRLKKTAADYMAIAATPVLIMLLVGSLLYFLLDVAYSGQYAGRLRWVLFWFVIAAVLIARIEIEMGAEHAAVYLLAFAGAMALVLFRFVPQPWLAAPLLVLGWWCAKKLTWDCTLIDDSVDASGEGLLAASGLDSGENAEDSTTPDDEPSRTSDEEPTPPDPVEDVGKDRTKDRKPHAPGKWVVYFSLAALPLFGLGQLLIPPTDQVARDSAFRLLWVYVASGLGLLITTSFLGLRRYLRQRRLQMPAVITGSWAVAGVVLAGAVLVVCLFMPRPDANYTFADAVDDVSEAAGKASEHAFSSDDAGEGKGRNVGKEADEDDKQATGEGKKGKNGKQAGDAKDSKTAGGGDGKKQGSDGKKKDDKGESDQKDGKSSNDGKQGKKKSDDGKQGGDNSKDGKQGDEKSKDGKSEDGSQEGDSDSSEQGEEESSTDSAESPQVAETVENLVKWIIYGGMAVFALVMLIRHRAAVLRGLAQFWTDLKNFFAGLFGFRRSPNERSAETGDETAHVRERKPFADYPNPFDTGQASRMPDEELVRYTYAALEAWAAEAGVPFSTDRTVREFLTELSQCDADLGAAARETARLYERLAYSDLTLPQETREVVRELWRELSAVESVA